MTKSLLQKFTKLLHVDAKSAAAGVERFVAAGRALDAKAAKLGSGDVIAVGRAVWRRGRGTA